MDIKHSTSNITKYDSYKLDESNSNKLSSQNIISYLDDSNQALNIIVYNTISSTNTVLKEMAANGAPEGTVLVSGCQTEGRGRLGRKFISPSDTGVYFSILLRPDLQANDSLLLTTSAAVATAKSIESIKSCTAGIKWVNDIFIDDLKVCGILTEGSINPDTNKLNYAIVGIGINMLPPYDDFPKELQNIAGSVFTKEEYFPNSKNLLVAYILNNFMELYRNLPAKNFFDEYKKRSILLGKKIYVIDKDNYIPATVLDIDTECHLIVKFDNNETKVLSSGEVSIKLFPPSI